MHSWAMQMKEHCTSIVLVCFQGDSAIVNRSLLLPKLCNRASFIEIEELPQPYSSFLPEHTSQSLL